MIHFTFDQIVILFTGIPAIYFSQHPNMKYRKMSPIFGLAGEPFWFYAAWTAGQMGNFILAVIYLFVWIKTFKELWWSNNYAKDNGPEVQSLV